MRNVSLEVGSERELQEAGALPPHPRPAGGPVRSVSLRVSLWTNRRKFVSK